MAAPDNRVVRGGKISILNGKRGKGNLFQRFTNFELLSTIQRNPINSCDFFKVRDFF